MLLGGASFVVDFFFVLLCPHCLWGSVLVLTQVCIILYMSFLFEQSS